MTLTRELLDTRYAWWFHSKRNAEQAKREILKISLKSWTIASNGPNRTFMNSPEKLSSAGTTPNKQVRGADRPSDHRGWPPEQPWLKVRTGVAKSPDTCGSHAGIYRKVIPRQDDLLR